MTKIYSFLGLNQASIDIPTGPNGSFHIEFTGGNIHDKKTYRPALSKPISDPAMQAVIENCDLFGSKIIVYEKIENEEEGAISEFKAYPEVTDFAGAVSVLKSEYDVKASQLRSVAGVRTLAASLNIEFPNWK